MITKSYLRDMAPLLDERDQSILDNLAKSERCMERIIEGPHYVYCGGLREREADLAPDGKMYCRFHKPRRRK